jgi:hypothetical protein
MRKIGYKRLRHLITERVHPTNLPLEDQFAFSAGMARILLAPLGCTPKRERPRCGARTRQNGRPCMARALWDRDADAPVNGRCRLHGGRSTGPKTNEGKRRIGIANRARAQARRLAKAQAAAEASALAAQARALEAYQAALALYAATLEHPMPDARFKAALLQIQWRKVEQQYQEYLNCDVTPT